MLGAHASFEWRKRNVLQTDAAQVRRLGRHFIVGYSSFPEVAVLAETGFDLRYLCHQAQCRGIVAGPSRIFSCAMAASAAGKLDAAMLANREARLQGAFPRESQPHDIARD
jgi:hypothetical protein